MTLIRNADLALPVVSLASDNLLDDLDTVMTLLNEMVDDVSEEASLIVANQLDAAGADERLEILKEFYGETFKSIRSLPRLRTVKRLYYKDSTRRWKSCAFTRRHPVNQ